LFHYLLRPSISSAPLGHLSCCLLCFTILCSLPEDMEYKHR
jgi:hypothetical protein